MEFNLNGLPDNAVHISGFRGDNERIEELNAVSLVDTVLPSLCTESHPLHYWRTVNYQLVIPNIVIFVHATAVVYVLL
jgi:hypothetical protein